MKVRVLTFERPGLVVKPRVGGAFTITYGEILTAERLRSGRGLRLHTWTTDPVRVACRGTSQEHIENELRRLGVRVVDSGARLSLRRSLTSRRSWRATGPPCDNRMTMPEANRTGRRSEADRAVRQVRRSAGVAWRCRGAPRSLAADDSHALKRGELRAFRSDEESRTRSAEVGLHPARRHLRVRRAGRASGSRLLTLVIRSYYTRRVRIERAIDAFLDWRRLERDATPRSIDSYRRIL